MRWIAQVLSIKTDGKLDFGKFANLSSIYFGIILLFLIVFNTAFALTFDPRHTTWDKILESLDPTIASVAQLVPNIHQTSQDLLASGYPDRAEIVVRVYSINWIVLIAALLALTPAILAVSIKMLTADLVVPRVKNAWFERAGTERGYLTRMALANICFGIFMGLAFLAFISFDRVVYGGMWFENTVYRDNHQLSRPALFWMTGIIALIWGYLWIVLYLRVRIRDLEGLSWRDANRVRKQDRRPGA